ncbi:TPA: BMP family ABC transporter substrate-binding protein [Candidatus Poribacteria bacterium]|nr:BMP family ABC transporter substrate-binding protein [Candidatus Poribacteria bacterium]
MRKITSLLILILCMSFVLTGYSSAQKDEQLKAAFVYVGPIGDSGWTFAHNEGRKALEEMGVQSNAVESVPEGAEAERVITQFASEGYDVIFTTSFGYMDTTIKVAEKFPNIVFGHCSGYKRAKNVFTYFGRMYQPKYLAGMIAGKMTKTDKIGYVAPVQIPEVIRLINAFTLGARSVNPNAEVRIVWTGAWVDPTLEMEAANALIDTGCDIIATGADSAAPMQAAEKKGLYSFGYDSDARDKAPKSFLTAPMWDWSVVYKDVITKIKAGFTDWENLDYWDGLESGIVKLAPYSKLVPLDIQEMVDARAEELMKNDDIFVGPIKDQNGDVKVQEGVKMTDKELLSFDWFVEGVVGTLK